MFPELSHTHEWSSWQLVSDPFVLRLQTGRMLERSMYIQHVGLHVTGVVPAIAVVLLHHSTSFYHDVMLQNVILQVAMMLAYQKRR